MSDHAPDDSMGLSDLDGFLTGIVVGPDLILPSEWLPVIEGGTGPEFQTEDEMRIVLGTIMGRYNEVVACFNSDREEFAPIFWNGPEGEVVASDWAGGCTGACEYRQRGKSDMPLTAGRASHDRPISGNCARIKGGDAPPTDGHRR